ncbi:protein amalgam-like [Mizuhopecten yessoensis]|uniref:Sodium/potassium-transporting ATPase subunit alpha n=1 Tax=Mizuhopecten yessoensis TaxID=6573 RepID=A0A210Q4S7_MIZYE|nr:protein amalgam-like [Mizuhopecten yessoensis]OWF43750.1 Sodium/potassium-transporting ATPase subunit alpha [Mizuhopecten yessoensis]
MKLLLLFVVLPVALCVDPEVLIQDTRPPTKRTPGGVNQIVINKSEDAYLTCVVHNKDADTKVEWRYWSPKFSFTISTGQDSKDPFHYQVDQPSAISWRLKIQNVEVWANARYFCQVLIGDKKYAKDERTLRVVDPPKILDLLTDSDMTIEEGTLFSLRCNATGEPFPKVKWERLAGGLLPSGGAEHADFTMNMGVATPSHRGAYKCTAENEAGKDTRIVAVRIVFKPRVEQRHRVVSQAVGYRTDLECTAAGYPIPEESQFIWTKLGKPVTGGNYKVIYIQGASDRVFTKLTIYNVQLSDYGLYSCMASNIKGDSTPAQIELKQSNSPTPDSTGQIRSGAGVLSVSLTTIFTLLLVCLLQRM